MTVVIAVLMAFHTVSTTVLIVFKTVETAVEMAFHTVEMVVWITAITVVTAVLMAFHTVVNVVWIPVRTVVKKPLTAFHTVVAADWIPVSTPEKKPEMPFQMPIKKSLMAVHTVSQSVPNSPRNASATPLSVLRILMNVFLMNSQIPTKICFTPSHAPCQSPVKIPMNTERMPEMVFKTTLRVSAISWNAPVNTGARREQNPFQMAFSISVMFWKSKPRALTFSTISWQKPWTVDTISFQISVMAARNPSLVFHRVIKAAVSVPMTATTAMTGAEMPPRAAPSFPKTPLAPEMLVIRSLAPWASFTNPCIAEPVTEMIFPRIKRNGPRAATTRPILTISSLVAGSRAFSLSINSCSFATISRMTGTMISPTEMARVSMEPPSSSRSPPRLSIMVWAMLAAAPSQFR